MSTFASIAWGIVAGTAGVRLLEYVADSITTYIDGYRFNKALEKLDSYLDVVDWDDEPRKTVRKKATPKKTAKRR